MYYVTKVYDHNLGLTACFRQARADSHCREPHGYPLAFKLTFGAHTLDRNHWVIDYGGLKDIFGRLKDEFDHRMILAEDDPYLGAFQELYEKCLFREILVLPFVGCEGFARYVFGFAHEWLQINYRPSIDVRGLHLASVEVREHAANSAIYTGDTN